MSRNVGNVDIFWADMYIITPPHTGGDSQKPRSNPAKRIELGQVM